MIKKIDRYILLRLLTITLFVLAVLIFIYLVIDFSENSDDFTDRGATMAEIFGVYYLNYIPEMVRLVIPVAVFIACIYLTGQMTERLEIVALKAAGISLYRLVLPYLVFSVLTAGIISYLDGYIIPDSNSKRIAFEEQYLSGKNERVDRNKIYRQESADNIFRVNYFDNKEQTGYKVEIVRFEGDSIRETFSIQRMRWLEEQQKWRFEKVVKRSFSGQGFKELSIDTMDTTLNIFPRDLARTTSDIYQLTYTEAVDYISSIERSGAGGASLPKIQFFGRLVYPFSIVVVTLIGFSIAAVRRKGGKGFYIAAGLAISFLYLVLMKIFEPFGQQGEIEPLAAALIPHLFFLFTGLIMLITARK